MKKIRKTKLEKAEKEQTRKNRSSHCCDFPYEGSRGRCWDDGNF